MPDIQPQIDPAQGFCIEVSCLPDGTFNVSVEPLEQESAEMEGPGHEAASIDEALAAAMEIYRQVSGGGESEESEEPMPEEMPEEEGASFEQGFKGVRGQGLGM